MTDWEITATTVYCDAVDDEVTLIVYRDGTIKCTGHQKYATGKAGNKEKNTTRRKQRAGCSGPDCPQVARYRDSLVSN